MNLVNGSKLSLNARREALLRFVHRLTTENGYPQRNPCGARVPAISDAQWLKEHDFYVKEDGSLSLSPNHCEPAGIVEPVLFKISKPEVADDKVHAESDYVQGGQL